MPSQQGNRMGTTTEAIAELLPAVRRGEKEAIDEVVSIAYDRLVQLIRDKKNIFRGQMPRGITHRAVRGNEQTEHIMGELYERLRNAVVGHKLADLQHPAGFWMIAANHVRYILLEEARKRKRERDRMRGANERPDDACASSDVSSEHAVSVPKAGGRAAAAALDDSQLREPGGRPMSPIEQVADQRHEDAESDEQRVKVLEAVGRLPEPHKTAIHMYYFLGATQRDIWEILRPTQPDMYERKVSRIIDQAEEILRRRRRSNLHRRRTSRIIDQAEEILRPLLDGDM